MWLVADSLVEADARSQRKAKGTAAAQAATQQAAQAPRDPLLQYGVDPTDGKMEFFPCHLRQHAPLITQ